MKHGCMVMTLRLSSSRRSGSRQIHRGWKKRVKFAAMSSPCWLFFWHLRHCPQGIHTPWSNHQWQVLLWGFEAAEGRHSVQMSRQVEEKQLVSPPWQHARSHITRSTIPDFQKHYSDSPPHPPICLTSPPATFSYSPRWNCSWKGIILTWLRRSTQKHKRLSTHSHLRTCRDAWNHEKHTGITVYMPKGTTLKETVETRSYNKKLFFMVKFPEFLGSPMYNRFVL